MSLVLWTQERFCQDICHLLWITATVDEDFPFLDQLPQPMPVDRNMFGSFMELRVPHHRNQPIVIAPDQCQDILLEQAEFAI